MSFETHALLKVIEAVTGDSASTEVQQALAEAAEQLYSDGALAPKLWQTKDGVRKKLRQKVRKVAHQLGFRQLKELPIEIEEMAIKLFAKGQYE